MRTARALAVAILGLAATSLATPTRGKDKKGPKGKEDCECLPKAEVVHLAETYTRLVGAFDPADAVYLSDDWVDVSQSINTFVGKPFDAVTFDKTSFVTSQSNPQGPPTPVVVEGAPIVDCNNIILIWSSTFGAGRPARGISVIRTDKRDGKWVMTRWDVEFNSLNWAFNMGQYY